MTGLITDTAVATEGQSTRQITILHAGLLKEILHFVSNNSYRRTVLFETYAVHSPTNALFINLVKSFKLTLNHTIISLLHVSVFNDHNQGALSVPN